MKRKAEEWDHFLLNGEVEIFKPKRSDDAIHSIHEQKSNERPIGLVNRIQKMINTRRVAEKENIPSEKLPAGNQKLSRKDENPQQLQDIPDPNVSNQSEETRVIEVPANTRTIIFEKRDTKVENWLEENLENVPETVLSLSKGISARNRTTKGNNVKKIPFDEDYLIVCVLEPDTARVNSSMEQPCKTSLNHPPRKTQIPYAPTLPQVSSRREIEATINFYDDSLPNNSPATQNPSVLTAALGGIRLYPQDSLMDKHIEAKPVDSDRVQVPEVSSLTSSIDQRMITSLVHRRIYHLLRNVKTGVMTDKEANCLKYLDEDNVSLLDIFATVLGNKSPKALRTIVDQYKQKQLQQDVNAFKLPGNIFQGAELILCRGRQILNYFEL